MFNQDALVEKYSHTSFCDEMSPNHVDISLGNQSHSCLYVPMSLLLSYQM